MLSFKHRVEITQDESMTEEYYVFEKSWLASAIGFLFCFLFFNVSCCCFSWKYVYVIVYLYIDVLDGS